MNARAASVTRDALALVTAARAGEPGGGLVLAEALSQTSPADGEGLLEALQRLALTLTTLAYLANEALNEMAHGHEELVDEFIQRTSLRLAGEAEE